MLFLLDRDGVINHDRPEGVKSVGSFVFLPRALEAIRLLKNAGHLTAIVTNQALVGRGELSLEGLKTIHAHMLEEIQRAGGKIDHLFYCTDPTIEPNFRRKPAPGMILEAFDHFKVSSVEAVMIGDSLVDLEAAENAGCEGVLVKTGKGRKTLESLPDSLKKTRVFQDLYEAVFALKGTK